MSKGPCRRRAPRGLRFQISEAEARRVRLELILVVVDPEAVVAEAVELRSYPRTMTMTLPPLSILVLFQNRSPSEELAWFARRTLGFALDRFRARIADVALRVRDENGSKGGVDQHCSLQVKVVGGGGDVFLQDVDASAEKCVHRLAKRAVRALGRGAARRRREGRR
jgi:hypothetical protein